MFSVEKQILQQTQKVVTALNIGVTSDEYRYLQMNVSSEITFLLNEVNKSSDFFELANSFVGILMNSSLEVKGGRGIFVGGDLDGGGWLPFIGTTLHTPVKTNFIGNVGHLHTLHEVMSLFVFNNNEYIRQKTEQERIQKQEQERLAQMDREQKEREERKRLEFEHRYQFQRKEKIRKQKEKEIFWASDEGKKRKDNLYLWGFSIASIILFGIMLVIFLY
jgi:hypothetical protein